jgi:hypothetical protein
MTEPAQAPPPPEWTPPEGDEEALRQYWTGQKRNATWGGARARRTEG